MPIQINKVSKAFIFSRKNTTNTDERIRPRKISLFPEKSLLKPRFIVDKSLASDRKMPENTMATASDDICAYLIPNTIGANLIIPQIPIRAYEIPPIRKNAISLHSILCNLIFISLACLSG